MHSNIYCKITRNLVKLLNSWLFLPTARKLGQGNIFTSVCLSTGGVVVCLFRGPSSKFWGVLQILGGCSKFSGRGGSSKFWGDFSNFQGVSIFSGVLQFFRGSPIFWGSPNLFFFFFNFFSPKKHSSGMHHPNTNPLRPPDGQCVASTHPTGMHSCSTAYCIIWRDSLSSIDLTSEVNKLEYCVLR